MLELPGHTLILQLQSPRLVGGLFPNVLTAVISALSLALLAVLALLARDTRLRQRAELGVADALAFRKAMEDSLVTGLRARDMTGRITYVNPAFCEMVGLSAEQLIGTGLPAPWWPPELVDEYQQRQLVRLAGQTLPREGYESVFQRSDGTRFPVLIIEAPLIDAQGKQTGFMSAILDLTEQRRVEDLNRTSQERLQATARLATVGEMASLLSHELNQPLAAISSYASGAMNLLEQPAEALPQADLSQAMQRISEQAERAGRVIKSVADFVRRREQVREAVSPQDLIDAIQPLLVLQAKKQGIQLQIDIAPGCPAVQCDRTMVEQVLLNLARNGMQAMPQGDPALGQGARVLRIAVHQTRLHSGLRPGGDQHKAWVTFEVSDHGLGLSPEVQEKLFTPFFTTRAEGMGLGLSLCRTVIEQHGGALTYEPNQPRGTVFRFTLPAHLSSAMTQHLDAKIYLVDDDAGVREALAWLLRTRRLVSDGYDSAEAFLGDASVWQHEPTAPCCVLLDVRMPGMSGLAAFELLQALPWQRGLPVIFLSGHADVATAVDAVKRGAFDFCEKPFSDNALVDRVERALDQSAQVLAQRRVQRELQQRLEQPHRPRARRDGPGGRRPAQQAGGRPAQHQRAHGGGPPLARVRQNGREVGGGAGQCAAAVMARAASAVFRRVLARRLLELLALHLVGQLATLAP